MKTRCSENKEAGETECIWFPETATGSHNSTYTQNNSCVEERLFLFIPTVCVKKQIRIHSQPEELAQKEERTDQCHLQAFPVFPKLSEILLGV